MVAVTDNALYECRVMHHRLTPKEHRFEYRVFYLWLDLDRLEEVQGSVCGFSRNRWNLFSFHDKDHLDVGKPTAKENLLEWLDQQGVDTRPISRVQLLTFPRVLGYIFNPVCFYFCFDAGGSPICAVAEVTNTYHEQKPYLLREIGTDGRFHLVTPKHFYVSPFSPLELCFDFKLRVPDEHLEIHIDDRAGNERVLLSTLSGERRALKSGRLWWFAVKYPLLTLRVVFLIHWHALLLWRKRLPVHAKAARTDLQRGVFKPHHSLSTPTKP